jgi:hypothetical protein
LARAHEAGVMEIHDRTDTPETIVRRGPAGNGDAEEERDRTRSEPAPTAAGPPMTPSSRSSGP